jgi:hypothetical protein
MNAFRFLMLSLAIVAVAASTAQSAPVGTSKARGVFNSGGWESGGGRSFSRQAYRAPAVRSYAALTATTAPATIVAQAPVEARRYSYAPPAAVRSVPCPPVTAAPSTANAGRRYSYAPAIEPAGRVPVQRYYVPSYSRSTGGGRTVDRWALPKTDPRKYNSR